MRAKIRWSETIFGIIKKEEEKELEKKEKRGKRCGCSGGGEEKMSSV